MRGEPHGRLVMLRLTGTSTGAGYYYASLQPTEGSIYKVLWAVGWHNEAGDKAVDWFWTDHENASAGMIPAATAAKEAIIPLGFNAVANNGSGGWLPQPVYMTRDTYARFGSNAAGAAETISVRALVEIIGGVISHDG